MSKWNFFPEIITKLPEANIPIEGVHSHLFQYKDQQFIYMSFSRHQLDMVNGLMVRLALTIFDG